MKSQSVNEPECCTEFDPMPWDDKLITWENKHFIKASVRSFFFMPLNFGKVMKMLDEKITKAGASMAGSLCLSDHTSRWNMDIYLAVDKNIPGIENPTLSGKYFSKVYEGPFRDTGKWYREYAILAKNKGLSVRKWYMWYTVCPKCAKKYGKNYVAIIGRVEPN